jgi:hypothetical protein
MRRLIVMVVLFIHFCVSVNAQEGTFDTKIMKQIKIKVEESIQAKSYAPLDEYVAGLNENIINDTYFHKYIMSSTYKVWRGIYYTDIMAKNVDDRATDKDLNELIRRVDQNSKLCGCLPICAEIAKYNLFEDLDLGDRYLKIDEIKKAGYKWDKEGKVIGAFYQYSKGQNWVGVEFAGFGIHSPTYKIKKDKDELKLDGCDNKVPFSASASSFSGAYDVSQRHFMLNFNAIHFTAPVVLKPLQLGVEIFDGKGYGYYRPEVGLGYNNVYASIGYTLPFLKRHNDILQRWFFGVSANFVL